MGHALQHTMMDVLTRHKRMCGYRTLWLPGMDHAGISTQLVVSRELKKEGLTRHDLGREKFIERVWQWKHESGGQILKQMRREGASRRLVARTVHDGRRIVARRARSLRAALRRRLDLSRQPHRQLVSERPDCACRTWKSRKTPQAGKLYYLRYPLKMRTAKSGVTVATTRPETMLGDTAVAVNPKDERYRDWSARRLQSAAHGARDSGHRGRVC